MSEWSITALNLPEHAHNPIHTDAGAQAAGYPRALVAGVTVYAYAVHVPAVRWGLDWARRGTAEVRFHAPVHDRDLVVCIDSPADEPWASGTDPHGEATSRDESIDVEVTVDLERKAATRFGIGGTDTASPVRRPGEHVPTVERSLTGEWDDHAARIGDTGLRLFDEAGVVHPAAWPSLANAVVHTHLVTGSWIHTRSRIRHHGLAPVGAVARIESTVVDRFRTRAGERAVLDVEIEVDGHVVASIEHEALVRLDTD